jgi:spore maturation protein CgeB
MRLVVLGLSITSSWGNGHATTYRGLLRELTRRGHEVVFLERDVPWYAAHRDLPNPVFCATRLYAGLDELRRVHGPVVTEADAVVLGSYVPDGAAVGEWLCTTANGVKAFYDIDTPVTLAKLARGEHEYLEPSLIPRFDLYLSFTGGPTLNRLEEEFGAPLARPLYCSVDERLYRPQVARRTWELGYLGTYSEDRQPKLDALLLEPAKQLADRRFVVAGPLYPDTIRWPGNVDRREHLPPSAHPGFYAAQRYTLNVTRTDMTAAGWSPSVRLFEAASCGVPTISDAWPGLDELFRPDVEILLADIGEDVLRILRDTPEPRRMAVARAARERVQAAHSSAARAAELETWLHEAAQRRRSGARRATG